MSGEAFNRLVRIAAGRDVPEPGRSELELERPVGDIVGRHVPGPAAFPRTPPSNEPINTVIRRGARAARSFTVPGGVSLDAADAALDDMLGR
jgi:hypothetical protein